MPAGAWVTTQFLDRAGHLRRSTAVSVVVAGTNTLAAITNRDGTASANPTNPGTSLVLADGQAGGIDSNGTFQCWAPIGDYTVWAGSTYLGTFSVYGGAGGGVALSSATPTATVTGGHAVGGDANAAHGLHAHDLGAHKPSHATGGSDPIAPGDIGAPTVAAMNAGDAAATSAAEANAHSYADTGDAATLASAEAYTDAHVGGGGGAATYETRIAKRMMLS